MNHVFQSTLSNLQATDQFIFRARLGFLTKAHTLQEIAEELNLTKQRIQQRQNKLFLRIFKSENWVGEIQNRIYQLLLNRKTPLYLDLVPFEDSWFKGFEDNNTLLSNILNCFSNDYFQVIDANGIKVVTRNISETVEGIKKGIKE